MYIHEYVHVFICYLLHMCIYIHSIPYNCIALHTCIVSHVGRVTDSLLENLAAILLELSFLLQHILGTLVLSISEQNAIT